MTSNRPRVCQTPGIQFLIKTSPSRARRALARRMLWTLGSLVDLPREFNLTEEEAIEMEQRIHDGLEWALAPLFQRTDEETQRKEKGKKK